MARKFSFKGFLPVYRRCPAGHWHRVSAENPECGHTGKILDWCEEWQRWVANPTKTAFALQEFQESEEFEIEREARLKLEDAIRGGDIKPTRDIARDIMRR